jgi:hypothetical protein
MCWSKRAKFCAIYLQDFWRKVEKSPNNFNADRAALRVSLHAPIHPI